MIGTWSRFGEDDTPSRDEMVVYEQFSGNLAVGVYAHGTLRDSLEGFAPVPWGRLWTSLPPFPEDINPDDRTIG